MRNEWIHNKLRLLETVAKTIRWPVERKLTGRIKPVCWGWGGAVLRGRVVLLLWGVVLLRGWVVLLGTRVVLWLLWGRVILLWLGVVLLLGWVVLLLRGVVSLLVIVWRVILRKWGVLGLGSYWEGGGRRLGDAVAGGLESILSCSVRDRPSLSWRIYVGVAAAAISGCVTFFLELYSVFLRILSPKSTVTTEVPLFV